MSAEKVWYYHNWYLNAQKGFIIGPDFRKPIEDRLRASISDIRKLAVGQIGVAFESTKNCEKALNEALTAVIPSTMAVAGVAYLKILPLETEPETVWKHRCDFFQRTNVKLRKKMVYAIMDTIYKPVNIDHSEDHIEYRAAGNSLPWFQSTLQRFALEGHSYALETDAESVATGEYSCGHSGPIVELSRSGKLAQCPLCAALNKYHP